MLVHKSQVHFALPRWRCSNGCYDANDILAHPLYWAIPFNKGTSPMDDFSVSVPGGIYMLGYLRIPL